MLKNLAILGALVKFVADGAGAYALDSLLADYVRQHAGPGFNIRRGDTSARQ